MTPVVLLPSVTPGETTHVRRYREGRGYWACSSVGWAPCPGHGAPASAAPAAAEERPCVNGHPFERQRIRLEDGRWRRDCRECQRLRWRKGQAR